MLELKRGPGRGAAGSPGMFRRARFAAASVSGWSGSSASQAPLLSGSADEISVMVVALIVLPIQLWHHASAFERLCTYGTVCGYCPSVLLHVTKVYY
jgi:hypothetical protein